MAVIATDIGGGGLSDGGGGHINLNFPSALHRLNVLAVGRILKRLCRIISTNVKHVSMVQVGRLLGGP